MVSPVVDADVERVKQPETLAQHHIEVHREVLYLAVVIEVEIVVVAYRPVVVPFAEEHVHRQVSQEEVHLEIGVQVVLEGRAAERVEVTYEVKEHRVVGVVSISLEVIGRAVV